MTLLLASPIPQDGTSRSAKAGRSQTLYILRDRNDVPSLRSFVAYMAIPPLVTRHTPVEVTLKPLACHGDATTFRNSQDCVSKRYQSQSCLLLPSLSRLQLQPSGDTDADIYFRTRDLQPGNNNRFASDQPSRKGGPSTASRLMFVLQSLVALLHPVDSLPATDGRKSWQTLNEYSR